MLFPQNVMILLLEIGSTLKTLNFAHFGVKKWNILFLKTIQNTL